MPNPAARSPWRAATTERLASIVDDLFLPLVAAYRGTVRSGA
jgi:hypothetical protein